MLIASGSKTGISLSAGVETDLLDGSTTGFDPQNADTIDVTIQETGATNAITTVKVYESSGPGGILAPLSATSSVAISGKRMITLKGYTGGKIRVTGNSAVGSVASCDIACYATGNPLSSLQIAFDGVVQGQALGGTVAGNLSQSGGTATIQATGAVVIDGTTSITIGGTNATSVAIGSASVPDSHPGGITIGSAKAVLGSGNVSVEATGSLTLGGAASTTSIAIGQATVVANFVGGLTIASAKAMTGLGNMAVESASGSTLTLGAASNAMTIGQATKLATVNGDVLLNGNIRVTAADAGAAGSSGTASAYAGTFTVSSGTTTYTLTNTKILATSLCFAMCISGAVARQINSFVPNGGGGSAVLTLSGAAGADSKFAFLIVNV